MSVKKQKNLIFILSIVLVITIVAAVFVRFSNAWFASDSDPVISSDEMQIASSEGLNIQLESASATGANIYSELNIKDIAYDYSTYFMPSQLSSSDGKNLYKRIEDNELISYSKAESGSGYIEVKFALVNSADTTTLTRDVYLDTFDVHLLDKDGNITSNTKSAEDAIRVSLEFEYKNADNSTTNYTYIMCLENGSTELDRFDHFQDDDNTLYSTDIIEKAASNKYYDLKTAVFKDGISNESPVEAIPEGSTAINCLSTQRVYFVSNFMKYQNNTLNSDYISLVTIPSGKSVTVTFRLWLEGADPRCDIPITGTKMYLKLKFGNETISN